VRGPILDRREARPAVRVRHVPVRKASACLLRAHAEPGLVSVR
jgi:hypothetical protein